MPKTYQKEIFACSACDKEFDSNQKAVECEQEHIRKNRFLNLTQANLDRLKIANETDLLWYANEGKYHMDLVLEHVSNNAEKGYNTFPHTGCICRGPRKWPNFVHGKHTCPQCEETRRREDYLNSPG